MRQVLGIVIFGTMPLVYTWAISGFLNRLNNWIVQQKYCSAILGMCLVAATFFLWIASILLMIWAVAPHMFR